MSPSDAPVSMRSTPWTGASENGRLTSTDTVWTLREAAIVQILEQYADLTEPGAILGIAGDDGAYPKLPHTYTHSVKQIETILTVMRDERRSQWWHVNERYIKATRTTKTKHRLRGRWTDLQPHEAVMGFPAGWTLMLDEERQKKKPSPTEHRVSVIVWNPQVRAQKVRLGVKHIAAAFPGEPYMPRWERKAA